MIIDAKLDVVGVVVADMARALAFYRLLGLDVPAAADAEPHVEVPLPGGPRLAFDTEATMASFHPGWRRGGEAGGPLQDAAVPGAAPASSPRPGTGGRVGLAFAVPDAAAVDAAYAQLTDAGYHGELEPFDAFWGMRYAIVHDPDGTGVDLFAPLAS
jgi:catechol 2,3-dioxygenase-like lactoylglutathione lyase family enzyme